MTLTRNLYELDEVVSALQICLRNGWPRGLFWLWELVVSGEDTVAHATLTDAWLYWGGGFDPMNLTEEDWVVRYLRIARAIQSAGSMNSNRFLNETAAMPTRPGLTPIATVKGSLRRHIRSAKFVRSIEHANTKEAAEFWISYDSACRQGLRTNAIWLLQAAQHTFNSDSIWTAITVAIRGTDSAASAIALLRAKDTNPLLFQAAATLLLCTPSAVREKQLAPTQPACRSQKEDWESWNSVVGTRRARIYAIPPEALHTRTTRGQMESKYTNIGDLRDPVPLFAEGCTFWRSAIQEYGTRNDETGAVLFPSDNIQEEFYERYFPDDIPDEWSTADQCKSHGRGCIEKAIVPVTIKKEPVSRLAWKLAIQVR